MVTAGVYLVIRAHPLYNTVPEVGYYVACLGAFVAIFAALMALVNTDLKRIIAYSTLSQLGYMFVAAGLGAYWIALFHLMTHAFFKSLLFLGAGNVMHAMHEELNITKMGGLWSAMKWTAVLMIIASVALAGIYPFAGFFSKDKILEVAFNEHAYVLFTALWLGAGLTAFYGFRLICLVFFGPKVHEKFHIHPHEASWIALVAMIPLAVLAAVSGFSEDYFQTYVTELLGDYAFTLDHSSVFVMVAATSAVALFGIILALYIYVKEGGFPKRAQELWIYKLLANQYFIPQLYQAAIVRPFEALARACWKCFDEKVIDYSVDLIARAMTSTGEWARRMQSGNLSKMLGWMVVGLVALIMSFFFYV
jgi:NADH-quinone oxidoreductase subunit L